MNLVGLISLATNSGDLVPAVDSWISSVGPHFHASSNDAEIQACMTVDYVLLILVLPIRSILHEARSEVDVHRTAMLSWSRQPIV